MKAFLANSIFTTMQVNLFFPRVSLVLFLETFTNQDKGSKTKESCYNQIHKKMKKLVNFFAKISRIEITINKRPWAHFEEVQPKQCYDAKILIE